MGILAEKKVLFTCRYSACIPKCLGSSTHISKHMSLFFFLRGVQVLPRSFHLCCARILANSEAMEIPGVRAIHLQDGSVLLLFDDSMASSMRCWPLDTWFRRTPVQFAVDSGALSPPSPGTPEFEDWRRRYLESVADCMRQIEALACRHHLPLASFPVYGELDLLKSDLVWNSDAQPEDAASLLMQTQAALILWNDV